MNCYSRAIKYRSLQIISTLICATLCSLSIAQSSSLDIVESDPVTDYLDAIETAEADRSAYSVELSDLYFGLGKSHFTKREYERARRAYQRGMQIERVNYGLNSLSQTPYLLSIAETESFLGNWKESQDALENLYEINSQAYGEKDPRMLPVLDELIDWYMDTYQERTRNGGYQNLVISERLGDRMNKILDANVPIDDPDAASRYRKISHLHYFIANHIKLYGEPSESGLTINSGSSKQSRDSTSHQHFRRGKVALEKVVESLEQQENSSDADKALAIAELGDWYLVFGQRMSASKVYKLAYDSLETSTQPEQLRDSLFGEASVIKFTALGEKRIKSETEHDLQVSMNISANGVAGKMEIINPPKEMSKNDIRAIYKDIRGKRFRPKLVDGETTESSIVYPYSTNKTPG